MQPSVVSNVDDPALVEMRRSQFVKAAGELFARKGYHKTTIREITQGAGLSTGLIYSYVRSKEDMLFLVLENILTSYLRARFRARWRTSRGRSSASARRCARTVA